MTKECKMTMEYGFKKGEVIWLGGVSNSGKSIIKTKEVINAFHPDYVKTYHPDLIEYFRLLTIQKKCGESMTKFVNKARKTNKNHGTIHGLKGEV